MPEDVKETAEQRREKRRAAADEAKTKQREQDIEAVDAFEVENDCELATLPINGWKASVGLPTLVGVRSPTDLEYRRYCQMIRKAKDAEEKAKAQDLLAESCWVYPAKIEERKAMKQEYPGVLLGVAIKAASLAEVQLEEGKGG